MTITGKTEYIAKNRDFLNVEYSEMVLLEI